MFYIADLHVHSHYSRATSSNLNLESLYQWARVKGINVVGTGDFTHPGWLKELKEKLEPDGSGLFRLKNPPREPAMPGIKVQDIDVRFCLSAEISSIYKYGEKVRKNHNLIYAPDFETVNRINARLSTIGNLTADGRPILGLSSRDLLEIVIECPGKAYLVPAHVWTPWFSTLGSKGGYDSIEECFRDLSEHIFAIETGLSSDPAMNWRWSVLDKFTLISNSDAHSPQKLGREANRLDTEFSYEGMFNAFKTQQGFLGTYEFFPEEGKYHLDGHRKCGIVMEPQETFRYKGICPVCGKPLTIGVLNRVEILSDRALSQKPDGAAGYEYHIPLPEILAEINGVRAESKSVLQTYQQIISTFGNEFNLLSQVPVEEIRYHGDSLLAEAIYRMRRHEVNPEPGYDGEYGKIRIFKDGELSRLNGQLQLFGMEDDTSYNGPKVFYGASESAENSKSVLCPQVVKPFSERFNEVQLRVKDILTGAVLVKAGPGTGKTSTLIQWIHNQIESGQSRPCEVMAITFTNKAAREISERLVGKLGNEAGQIISGTFHAIALRMLQERYPDLVTVYDESNRLSVLRFLFPDIDEKECKNLSVCLVDLFEKNKKTAAKYEEESAKYRQYCHEEGAVDISDILGQLLELWEKEPDVLDNQRIAVHSIAVDEFQDINPQQYRFMTMLGKGKNLLAIGDPDQAIYGFRGSDVRLFFRFAEEFKPVTINLTENYRSIPSILKSAGALILQNTLRSGIELNPVRKGSQKIKLFQAERPEQEAKFITAEIEKKVGGFNLLSGGTAYEDGNYAFSDIAVLYRTHHVGRQLLSVFKQSGIPVVIGDGTSFLNSEPFTLVSDILKLSLCRSDKIALSGILSHLPGWGKKEIRNFMSLLHETGKLWSEQISDNKNNNIAADSLLQFKNFFAKTDEWLAKEGVACIVNNIFALYLPDNELSEEQLLKKESIFAAAGEAGKDVRTFLNDSTLNNYNDTGREHAHGVHLLTFHAAKGLEFSVVFLAGAEDGITPSERKDSDTEEERRLFYVAMTRARDELYISASAKRMMYGKEEQHHFSRFISDIPCELIERVLAPKQTNKKTLPDNHQLSLF